MRIRIVVQGATKWERWRKYWGLSMLIGEDVLFDTFADPAPLEARFSRYGIDAAKIRHIVISHDHWDHTGGLWRVLDRNRTAQVYVCRGVNEGLKNRIRERGNELVEVGDPLMIRENVHTSGEIMGEYAGRPMAEQSLVVTQGGKLALLTGCSHPGILEILSRVSRLHRQPIDLVLGGLHLADAAPAELNRIVHECGDTYRIATLASFHCTGERAVKFLRKRLPGRVVSARTGDAFDFNAARAGWERTRTGSGR